MLIKHFFTPGLAINSYLVYDEEVKRGAVIDPTRDVEQYLAMAKQEGVEISAILETHVHADFISGATTLKAALNQKPVIHCSGMGGKEWTPAYADTIVQNRDEIALGPLRLQAWHTPGHTPEHVMWLAFDDRRSPSAPECAFTGDVLFVGSVGRPDLLGPEAEETLAKQLYLTLFKELHPLPDFVEVYPGHGAGSLCGKNIGKQLSSTFGYEKRSNPGLIPQEYHQWLKVLHNQMPASPRYFKQMKRLNLVGPRLSVHGEIPLLTKAQLMEKMPSGILVDVRTPDEFAAGSIAGALNIPLAPQFPVWAGSVLPYDRPLVIIATQHEKMMQAVKLLRLVGFDDVAGYVDVNSPDQKELLSPKPMIECKQLQALKDNFYILDVRTISEWNAGHIDGAHHIELTQIPEMLHNIPSDKPIATICHSGNRASIVTSLLSKERALETYNVKGGMQAWTKEFSL